MTLQNHEIFELVNDTYLTLVAELNDSIVAEGSQEGVTLEDQETEAVSPVPCSQTVFFFLVYGPMYGIVCGFGLIGNSLSFAVLHKYSRDTVSTYLLKTLAVMDNVFLATAAFVQMYPAMALYFGRVDHLTPIFKYFQTLAWPLAHIVQLGSVWMMVLVAANRYIAVCRPLHAAHLCSKRQIRLQIIIVLLFTTIYNVPRFAEYDLVIVNETQTDVITNVTITVTSEVNMGLGASMLYNILYENVAYCLVAFLLPLVVLLVLNVNLVRALRLAQNSRQALIGRKSAEENNITFVLIVVIITFIVCQTPASLNQILYYIVDDQAKTTCSDYFRFYHVSNLVITVNSSVNFVIYCLFRKQFQQELRALVCRTGHAPGHTAFRRTIILRALHTSDVINSTDVSLGRFDHPQDVASRHNDVITTSLTVI